MRQDREGGRRTCRRAEGGEEVFGGEEEEECGGDEGRKGPQEQHARVSGTRVF